MYQLLKSKHHPFPSIVEVGNDFHPMYIRLGYEKIAEGTYKEMEKKEIELVTEYLKGIKDEVK
jgi:hypothetical protein